MCVVARLVSQLRCAVKAKNVIIAQLEDEKRDAVVAATGPLHKTIDELRDRLCQLETPADVSSFVSYILI